MEAMLGFGLALGLKSSLLYGVTFLGFLVYRKVALGFVEDIAVSEDILL